MQLERITHIWWFANMHHAGGLGYEYGLEELLFGPKRLATTTTIIV